MNERFVISRIQPVATEEEVVAVSTAMQTLWPERQQRRQVIVSQEWRFSRRRWRN